MLSLRVKLDHPEKEENEMAKQNPAAALARMRTTSEKECGFCGETFAGLKVSKYCSESCKQKAKRARKAEAEATED